MIPRRSSMLSIGQQTFMLKSINPEAQIATRPHHLVFRASVQPTAISRCYNLLIEYRLGSHPVSRIVGPNLGLLTAHKIPHLWKTAPYELCLYYSKRKEWLPHMHIAHTIYPWCLEWMFHFECWLGTGTWDGGGTQH